jgi:hexosaminidase
MSKLSFSFLLFIGGILLSLSSCQQPESSNFEATYNIIPQPGQMEKKADPFYINDKTKIVVESSNEALQGIADYLSKSLEKSHGVKLEITDTPTDNSIGLYLTKTAAGPEGYQLSVSDKSISLSAGAPTGIFHGIQTMLQLMHEDSPIVSGVEIDDAPRYAYRGMHLDVGRHFFPVDFIKKYIDYLARYKYNYFHWHLTEDQGWRIEIKKYPKLQEVAAYRNETLIGHYSDKPHKFDGQKYGGYYTQEEVKEIVAYATERHITVIPEIEMPGHAQAALAAYPELACTDGPIEVATKWGVFPDVYCPTEITFGFLEDVLMEVFELFPSKYIHIGGDECPKTAWENSEFCQDLIKKEGLKDEHGLQSYFIQRMEKFINANGRSIIGWDEILEGGLAPNATVMSWRGIQGGIEAAEQGHDVIMTPGSHCYFDHYQSDSPDEPLAIGGFLPLEKVYSFDPTPKELSPEHAKHILGGQANVWTEYLKTPESVEYMIFPRMCALAEALWSPKENLNYEDFMSRLEPQLISLKKEGVNVANHLFDIISKVESGSGQGISVSLSTGSISPTIRYNMTGEVNADSPEFSEAILIDKSGNLKASSFINGEKAGRGIDFNFNLHKAAGKKIELENAPSEKYNAGGIAAIINGLTGSDKRYGDAEWLGFSGEDCIATIDLGEATDINKLSFRFYKGIGQWIYPPKLIEVFVSDDGENFTKAGELTEVDGASRVVASELSLKNAKGQFLKIHIHRHGIIGKGLQGVGNEAWLFVDEIVVE